MTISILLADDHKIFRESLRLLLERQEDFYIVGEAANGQQAVILAERLQPDVIVLDLTMPGLDGLEAIRLIKSRHPTMLMVILSAHDEEIFVTDAFRFGASAYVFKEQSAAELVQAVRAAVAGERYISPRRAANAALQSVNAAPPSALPNDALTVRERQVLKLTAQGLTNAQIGEQLSISARTVETHRAHLMLKLGLKSRQDLTRYAEERQLG